MKKHWQKMLLVGICAVAVAFVGMLTFGSQTPATAQEPVPTSAKAAVMLLCRASFFTDPPGGFTVLVADSSPDAPVIQRGTPCADALEILFEAGFAIRDASGDQSPRPEGILYTLVRPIGLAQHGGS